MEGGGKGVESGDKDGYTDVFHRGVGARARKGGGELDEKVGGGDPRLKGYCVEA